MQDANLYSHTNLTQIEGAQHILHEHRDLVKNWKCINELRLLDIGTGDGAVLVDVILEAVTPNYNEVLGVDILPDMIQVASAKYRSVRKLSFHRMDIATGDAECVSQLGTFNLITSFFCLNWVKDQSRAFSNIFKLLQPRGQSFIVIVRQGAYTPVYRKMVANPEWAIYMEDWQEYPSVSYSDCNWKQNLTLFLGEAGFTKYQINLTTQTHHFQTKQELKDMLQSINPFIHRMPLHLRDQFMDELLEIYLEFDPRLELSYESIVLHATKE